MASQQKKTRPNVAAYNHTQFKLIGLTFYFCVQNTLVWPLRLLRLAVKINFETNTKSLVRFIQSLPSFASFVYHELVHKKIDDKVGRKTLRLLLKNTNRENKNAAKTIDSLNYQYGDCILNYADLHQWFYIWENVSCLLLTLDHRNIQGIASKLI